MTRTAMTRLAAVISRVALILLASLAVPGRAVAGPATQLDVIFPCCPAGIGGCRIIATHPGEPLCISFAPVDGTMGRDPNWTGTVIFSSSDPLAVVPQPCTFAPSGGTCTGDATVVFRTLGDQTLTLTDAAGVLQPGTANMRVLAAATAVPALDWIGSAAVIGLLAVTGAILVRRDA